MMERGTEVDKKRQMDDDMDEICIPVEHPFAESVLPEVVYDPDYDDERQNDDVMDELVRQPELRMEVTPVQTVTMTPAVGCSAPEVHYKPDYGDDYKVTKRQNDDVMNELVPYVMINRDDNRETVTMTPAVGCSAPEVHYRPDYGDDYKVTKVVCKPDYVPEDELVCPRTEMLEEACEMMETQMTDGQLDTQKDFKESKDDRLSDDDRLASEQKVNDTLKEGDLDKIQNMITPNKLTKCKTNTLEKSLEVSYELKRLSKKQGPDADDFKSMATSVEDFAIQLLEPLKSDDMKRAIFAGKDFDRVVDKAVFYQQKKFVSHPVVYNLLKKRWVGRFYHHKYSSWMDLQWWKWIFLNVWAMFDVFFFPVVFLTLYCLHSVIGLLKKRQDVRVILMLNAKWKYASKEFEKMKDLCSSIMDGSANDGKVMFASIIRYQQQHSISEFKDLATVKADMIQTSALDETPNNFTFMGCLKKAMEMFGSVHKFNSKVLIIMTDDKSDAVMDLELIKDLKDSKTRVLSVGFGIQPEIKELVTMATNDESVFLYNRDINLENLSKQMLKSIKGHDVFDKYTSYFTTPYFIFLRDTISYLALLALHFAMCLQPSTLHLTALEWIVMLFFIGRLMMEINQVIAENDSTHLIVEEQKMRNKRMSGYFSDWWNILDVATLAVYSFLIVIRFITWAEHISVSKNRLLAVAGYMYGLNTMFLTLRVFGQIMEFSKSTGSIQIALFQIMGAVIAIFGQFLAAILAFSLVLTKIYVAEVSLNGSDNTTTHGLCADGSQSGLACWWTSAQFLAWSLMGIADLAPLSSSDDTSDMIAKLLYIIFLIMGVIMLMNMMIALLSNTYQQVEDNAFYEWSFRKTTTIRTYSDYHCVPVPFNVISLCWVLLRNVVNTVKRKCNCPCCKKTKRHQSHELLHGQIEMHSGSYLNKEKQKQTSTVSFFDCLVIDLQNHYFSAYGYTFPMEESSKIDQVLKETDGSHRLIGHIANRVFRYDSMEKQQLQSHGVPEWDTKGIDINGQRLSYRSDCDCNDCWQLDERDRPTHHGAKYLTPLSKQWPGFEVLIQESGERRFIAIGVVSSSYELHSFPGWGGNSAGYHIDDGKIFDRDDPKLGRECKDAMAYRGDLIGCRVLYGIQIHGSVPVQFTLNDRVIGEGSINTERTSTGIYAFVGIGGEDISLVFRLCPYQHRELQPSDVSTSQLDYITKQIEQIRGNLSAENWNVSNQLKDIARRQSDIEHKVSLLYDNLMHSRESGGNVNLL